MMFETLLLAADATVFDSVKLYTCGGFTLLVLILMALDLGVFHRHAHVVKMKSALILVLAFVGVKMCLVKTEFKIEFKIDTDLSLFVILGFLGAVVLASWIIPPKDKAEA